MSTIQDLVRYFWPGGTVGPYRGSGDNVGLTEAGVDVMLPGGTPIYALTSGSLSPYSTQYSAVEQTSSGYDYYQHINLNPALTPGAPISAGELLGYVKPESGLDTYSGTNALGETVTYTSNAPHVEFGTAPTAAAAGFDLVSQTGDPAARLAAIQAAGGSGDTPTADGGTSGGWTGSAGAPPSTPPLGSLLSGLALSPELVIGGIAVLLLIVLVA